MIPEQVSLIVQVLDSIGHIVVLYKELSLDLVAIGRRRLIWVEMVNLFTPHAKARFYAGVRASAGYRVNRLN